MLLTKSLFVTLYTSRGKDYSLCIDESHYNLLCKGKKKFFWMWYIACETFNSARTNDRNIFYNTKIIILFDECISANLVLDVDEWKQGRVLP